MQYARRQANLFVTAIPLLLACLLYVAGLAAICTKGYKLLAQRINKPQPYEDCDTSSARLSMAA